MEKQTKTTKEKGILGLGAMVVLGAACVFGSTPLYNAIDQIGKTPGEAIYTAGTYTGSAEGFGGAVTASVTVTESEITAITLSGDGETPGIGTNAFDQLPDAIIAAQSGAVDAVSGATITSDAVKIAVDAALAGARGEEVPETTTAAAAEETTAGETGAETTKAETTEAEITGNEYSDIVFDFTPGTYEAVSQGMYEMKLKVKVSEDAIETIEFAYQDETEEIAEKALTKIPEEIISQQSVDIDSISGATMTSDGIKAAVADCLRQASKAASAGGEETVAAGADSGDIVFDFVPGTYEAVSEGMYEMKLKVTVSETAIETIEFAYEDETDGIADKALENIPALIIEGQTLDVDGISGATLTSDGIKAAVTDCLKQAAKNAQ